ncbi:MAG TPA: type VI secretion system tube protein Hcp [Limnobacter sp.]|nr:type VI secretion system tube protein Hcp [Limnobacter sp.]
MRADIFLKLPAISGESIDQQHPGEIEIQMVEWTMNLPANTSGRGGVGRVEVGELILRKQVDSSTPVLHAYCCSGAAMPEAVLVKRKSGTVPLEYYKLTMKEVLVSHVHYSMGSPRMPTMKNFTCVLRSTWKSTHRKMPMARVAPPFARGSTC